ncbi:tetratricopeptide repeat protein [Alteromonas sp. 5E99-2]|uniref:tetratricopeptide repeat protein n=1 Tax=Alteromonas sp. 5E99-2 TaxID=2817683 RepID=UPI001A988868|nr:tetratricopeptide repeat protein [Alteromonas sp. 5E99-2]MBO1254381.1 tetratricopeptide repeat protein [Alteromonas sp. 5E99-2]
MKFILVCLLLCASSHGLAENTTTTIETIQVLPEGFEKPIEYKVTLPQNYATDLDKEYFVLFDLHPKSQMYISGMHDWLSHNGEWPWLETIIVTPADYHEEFASTFTRLVNDPKDQSILDVIEKGVLRTVDEKYRTNGYKIYNGFMGNGALGLYVLLNRPTMFNAYLIASPALAGDFGNVILDAPEKLTLSNKQSTFLYMAIGNHGYERSHVLPFKQFEQELQNLPKGKLQWTTNNSEHHAYMSRPVITLLNGIEALFDDIHNDLSPDSDISKQGPDAIIRYYETLSKEKYGFTVSAEGSLKALAKSLVEQNPKAAIEIYERVTQRYPNSAYAYASLAKAYADQGEIHKAIQIQQIAVEKSKSMVQWHQNKHQQYLDEFKAMLDNSSK